MGNNYREAGTGPREQELICDQFGTFLASGLNQRIKKHNAQVRYVLPQEFYFPAVSLLGEHAEDIFGGHAPIIAIARRGDIDSLTLTVRPETEKYPQGLFANSPKTGETMYLGPIKKEEDERVFLKNDDITLGNERVGVIVFVKDKGWLIQRGVRMHPKILDCIDPVERKILNTSAPRAQRNNPRKPTTSRREEIRSVEKILDELKRQRAENDTIEPQEDK